MAAPTIIISSQARVGLALDVDGWITGAASATISLPADSPANGAVSKPAQAITLRPSGYFSARISSIAAGDYAAPIVTATASDGSTATASGIQQRIYANGTAPTGHPVVTFPPVAAPTPTPTVAMDGIVTDFKLVSTSGAAQSNVPFTFGQPFKKGELAPTDKLVGKIAGEADLPLQFNVKATHSDGSVRHAIISGVLPALPANATKTVDMTRVASSAVSTTPVSAGSVAASGLAASIAVTVDGITYTATATDAIASAQVWFGGEVATDFTALVPMKDGSSNAHAGLVAYFSIRFYPGQNKAKIDMAPEHAKAYTAVADVTYDVVMTVGGATVYSKSGLTHFPRARWKKTFWWNGKPELYIKHNRDYLIDSRAVSNYDRRVTMSETTLAGYVTDMALAKFDPMKPGRLANDTTGPGAKPYLGLAPDIYAAFVLSTDKRAFDIMLAQADCGGTYATHLRDHGTGPAAGHPMDVNHYPKAGMTSGGDSANPSTGVNEVLANYTGITTVSVYNQDTAHQPALAYIPYLVTGDHYYLEEMLFWSHWNNLHRNPGGLAAADSVTGNSYREWHRGVLSASLQVRAQAWGMRALTEAAAFVPDDHISKKWLNYSVDCSVARYDLIYTDNPDANLLHFIPDVIYSVNGVANTGIGNFQDDFWAQAIGRAVELGYARAKRVQMWKLKWQINRLIGEGYCFNHACYYNPQVRATAAGPFYTTMAEVLNASVTSTVNAHPCNSQARIDQMNAERPMPSNPYSIGEITGNAQDTDGYPSNLRPAVAMAVDAGYPDAGLAWELLDAAPTKPQYNTSPQFAIAPRTDQPAQEGEEPLPDTAPPDNYTIASGQAMYFGMAAPVVAPANSFDSVALTTSRPADAEAPGGTLNVMMSLHESGGGTSALGAGNVYEAAVSGRMAYDSHTAFKFATVRAVVNSAQVPGLTYVKPSDLWPSASGGVGNQSGHQGFRGMPEADVVHLIGERRYDALYEWMADKWPTLVPWFALGGGSMGAWGTLAYGIRRPDMFAALYADRPRWGPATANTGIALVYNYNTAPAYSTVNSASPTMLAPEDGGGKFFDYMNLLAIVADTSKELPWIGWSIGRNDGFATFGEQIEAVNALRAAGRGFAFAWNNGTHTGGPSTTEITASYPVGTFKIGRGYPLFTDHSGDQDPNVDTVGGINIGLSFRNVVETASGWSCEVTSILGARTVKIKPVSKIFAAFVTAQLVTIPAANTWVPVSFSV